MNPAGDSPHESQMARLSEVKARHLDDLLGLPNVVGVGVGLRQQAGAQTGELAIMVMVQRKIPRRQLAERDIIPSQIEGVPVDVVEVGRLDASLKGG
jgi:hypothetical protein